MKSLTGLLIVASAIAFTDTSKTQEPVPPPAITSLADVPELLKKEEDKLIRKIDSVRATVEDEGIAKHLSEAALQSLRWSLQSSGSGSAFDARDIIATARVPIDNLVLATAFKELETVNALVQSRRNSLMDDVKKDIFRRTAEILRNSTKPAEIEELKTAIENLRSGVQRLRGVNSYLNQSSWTTNINLLNATKRLIEAEANGDLPLVAVAINQLQNFVNISNEPNFGAEIQARIDRLVTPFTKALEEKQNALDAAFEAGKPYAEITKYLGEYSEALDRYSKIQSPYINTGGQAVQSIRAYRALVSLLGKQEAGSTELSDEAMAEARDAVKEFSGKRIGVYNVLFAKWTKEFTEKHAALRQEREKIIRSRLAGAKQPSDMESLLRDLQTWTAASRQTNNELDPIRQLSGALLPIAAAWSSNSLAILQRLQARDESISYGSFTGEVSQLFKRIERDVLSRVLRAPELNMPETAGELPEDTLEKLSDSLAQKGEWRRLYRLLEARGRLRPQSDSAEPEDDALASLRSFFAAQNFTLAEQWIDAVRAYKSVLRSSSERAPIKAAAEGLKVLAKEHPEAIAAANATPDPAPQFRAQ